MIIDTFGGPGGWDEALRLLDRSDVIGIEWDAAACATRAAAGHATIRADVAAMPTEPFAGKVEGVIGSPPCPTWSQAGKREGFADVALVLDAAAVLAAGGDNRAELRPRFGDPRSLLVVEPVRWVRDVRPTWVALEQVPPVLPLWEMFATIFRGWGYSCWTGILNAADYGVPQTRRRAILLAHATRPVHPPDPTHAQDPTPTLFGPELAPWVSMAEALGWTDARLGFPRKDDRGDSEDGYRQRDSEDGYRQRDWRDADEPSFALTEKARSWTVRHSTGEPTHGEHERDVTEPAPTVDTKARSWVVRTGANSMVTGRTGSRAGDGDVQPYERSIDQPAPTVDGKVGSAWRVEVVPADDLVVNTGRDWKPGGDRSDAQRIPFTDPAPTIDATGRWLIEHVAPDVPVALRRRATGQAGARANDTVRAVDEPAPPLAFGHNAAAWAWERPCTTIAGDPRAFSPGGHIANDGRDNTRMVGRSENAIRLDVAEAAVLQSFRADYPWQGNRSKQFEQVGNAIPPLLAAACLRSVLGASEPGN